MKRSLGVCLCARALVFVCKKQALLFRGHPKSTGVHLRVYTPTGERVHRLSLHVRWRDEKMVLFSCFYGSLRLQVQYGHMLVCRLELLVT